MKELSIIVDRKRISEAYKNPAHLKAYFSKDTFNVINIVYYKKAALEYNRSRFLNLLTFQQGNKI